ncbi:SANT/Myb_domain [Hexamita inflata]|uniref:SANT/Myb domain n=1 Tax=Hexamita inflata TaxID=28002 RepID=A0AA86RGY3_9EUKA|nr:SANT/Myb domain [Hexamita inflata]
MPHTMQRWTEEEINLLHLMILKYKKNFKYVDIAIPTRSYNQVKSRYFNELRKQQKLEQLAESQHTTTDGNESLLKKFIPIQEPVENQNKVIEKLQPQEIKLENKSKRDLQHQSQWSEFTFKIFE